MNFRRHLLPLLLLILPLGVLAQSQALMNLQENYDKIRLRYFYESVIRAGANVALGEEGVKLTKGIQKVVTTNFEHSIEREGALADVRKWLKNEGYETYIEITNRGNLAGMASFFMNIIGQNADTEADSSNQQLNESVREMAVYALDNGKVIKSLVVVLMGENSNQIYELDGNLELESIPELIGRVQKFIEILE